ncbi:MAG: hypothetical protein HC840_00335 [Leptolyngbyaceae cyanobacterium RM2_2_4]|nr:hypothetical protein [Leptolyngbyaceae cyanobacterium RM2_2_4]
MAKYIYNLTEEARTYQGREIAAGAFYQITANLDAEYASDSQLISDLALGIVKMSSNGSSALSGSGSSHVDFLKNSIPPVVTSTSVPFAAKILPNGKKLYTRIHGVSQSVLGAPDNIDFTIPHTNCKLTGIQIINGELGDKANLKILDTDAGLISGIPNAVLNQFGFSVNMGSSFYEFQSNYDADLILGMKIRLEFDAVAPDLLPKTVYINFILHEVKD